MDSRARFDLVVFGATGVTGRQVVRHLDLVAPESLRWALAGRDRARLEDLAAAVKAGPSVLVADAEDLDSVTEMVGSTSVIINTVGPYASHAGPIYAACAAMGVDQVDACAELDWLAAQIEAHHERARASGSRIVHSAGFESLPFDMAVACAAEALDEPLQAVDVAVTIFRDPPMWSPRDLLTSASVRSATEALRRGKPPGPLRASMLCPGAPPVPFETGAHRHRHTGEWLGPMFPSPYLNPAVVYRSAWLADDASRYSPDFRYREGMLATAEFLPGVGPRLAASLSAGAQTWSALLAMAPGPVRELAAGAFDALVPAGGSGPDEARLSGWRWRLDVVAGGTGGSAVAFEVRGAGHPGYRSSANLMAQTAMALVDRVRNGTDVVGSGGILSPAAALGAGFVERLEPAGVTFGEPQPV